MGLVDSLVLCAIAFFALFFLGCKGSISSAFRGLGTKIMKIMPASLSSSQEKYLSEELTTDTPLACAKTATAFALARNKEKVEIIIDHPTNPSIKVKAFQFESYQLVDSRICRAKLLSQLINEQGIQTDNVGNIKIVLHNLKCRAGMSEFVFDCGNKSSSTNCSEYAKLKQRILNGILEYKFVPNEQPTHGFGIFGKMFGNTSSTDPCSTVVDRRHYNRTGISDTASVSYRTTLELDSLQPKTLSSTLPKIGIDAFSQQMALAVTPIRRNKPLDPDLANFVNIVGSLEESTHVGGYMFRG